MNTRVRYAMSIAAAALAAVFASSAIGPASPEQRKSIRWATSNPESYGYKVAASMGKVLQDALGGEYAVTVQPYSSTTGAMKAAMEGAAEIGYTADIGMRALYDGEGGFRDYKPVRGRLVHTWYAYPMETFMAVPAAKADEFKCWKDFSGKPAFYTTAGFMNWLNARRVYDALGYEFRHVEIDPAKQPDALKSGSIIGAAAYTTAGRSLASYWRETEMRMDIKLVNPCPDEVQKLKAAGLAVVEVDPKLAFSRDVGVKSVLGVPILFAYNVRADISEEVIYTMLSAFYEARSDLAKIDPGFTPLARDFIGLQVHGINANPDIPAHPGLARFLREQKAWNDQWKIAGGG